MDAAELDNLKRQKANLQAQLTAIGQKYAGSPEQGQRMAGLEAEINNLNSRIKEATTSTFKQPNGRDTPSNKGSSDNGNGKKDAAVIDSDTDGTAVIDSDTEGTAVVDPDNNNNNNNDNDKKGGKGYGFDLTGGLGYTFRRDVAASLQKRQGGNAYDRMAAGQDAAAEVTKKAAGDKQKLAQEARQIANRNEYTEAGKIASVQNDAQNRQNIANREGISGASAALMRKTNDPDVQSVINRNDAQRDRANQYLEEARQREREVNDLRTSADQYRYASRDMDAKSDAIYNLSKAEGKSDNESMGFASDYQPPMTQNDNNDVSDKQVKNIHATKYLLSDFRMKSICDDIKSHKVSPLDCLWLMKQFGRKHRFNDIDYDMFDDDTDDSVLNDYAEHIRNYVYTYKPEAQEIDDSIDPEEEHIGPMAQDIEQVNPACIKETPEGVKTVDTGRLALMNAGAIGDLARELNELNDKFKALGL